MHATITAPSHLQDVKRYYENMGLYRNSSLCAAIAVFLYREINDGAEWRETGVESLNGTTSSVAATSYLES